MTIPELTAVEARVLGCLIEKDLTTPEYYPLSLNALMNACNQKSSRDPVVNYDESTVEQACDSLRAKGLVLVHTGSRATKYSHRLSERFNFGRRASTPPPAPSFSSSASSPRRSSVMPTSSLISKASTKP